MFSDLDHMHRLSKLKTSIFFLQHKTADRLISDKSVSKEIRKSKDSSYVS